MKQLYFALFSFLIFNTLPLFGQSFSGTVLDKETNEPIPFADVYFTDLKTGTITNSNGQFSLPKTVQSSVHIQISFIGYATVDAIINVKQTSEKTFYLEQSHLKLEEIVLSTSSGKLQRENVVNVTVKKMDALNQTAPLTLAEALSNIPGVEQNTTGSGIGKPVIRGLSGNRIVTYAQGIRIENQQWGDEHGLGIGEVGIESVEVLKGPSSLLYGSDALGGVLYFVDERFARENTTEGFVQSKFLSNTLGTMNSAGFKMNKGLLKWNVFGAYASHADYKTPNDNRVFNTRFDEKNIKTSLGFHTKSWVSTLHYSFIENQYGITEAAISSDDKSRRFDIPFQSIANHSISSENKFFIDESKLSLTLGYSNNNRKEFEEEANVAALGLVLDTYTFNAKWNSPTYKDKYSFVLGSQGMLQENKNEGEELLIPDATTTDLGFLGLATIDLNKLQLQGGMRVDSRKIDTKAMQTDESDFPALNKTYQGFTFSTGLAYKADKTKYRFNVSSGFRAPNTSELLSNGVHEGTNRYEIGNNNLVKEQALQMDFSFDYEEEHVSFGFNPFFNNIKDYVYLSPTGTIIADSPAFEYLQTDAFLYGGEMGVHFHPHAFHWLHLESNLSMVYGEDKSKNALPLIPQTKINTVINAELATKGTFSVKNVFLQHVYKFKQSNIGLFETQTAAYHVFNLGVDMAIASKKMPMEINTGIKNLFNTDYIDHLSRFKNLGIANQGFNFYVGLKVSLL